MNYIIFDLEATCWEGSSRGRLSEIIEIGAVKIDSDLNSVSEFQTFVKPTQNPELSDFCTQLTSITQSQVDDAPIFYEAMVNFENWITEGSTEVTLLSWGRYDKGQIEKEATTKAYYGEIINLLNYHYSLKHQFAEYRGVKLCGMAGALYMLDIKLKGMHHRGIDDARNIAKIFKATYTEWINYMETNPNPTK